LEIFDMPLTAAEAISEAVDLQLRLFAAKHAQQDALISSLSATIDAFDAETATLDQVLDDAGKLLRSIGRRGDWPFEDLHSAILGAAKLLGHPSANPGHFYGSPVHLNNLNQAITDLTAKVELQE
jgi:hypothetical protein